MADFQPGDIIIVKFPYKEDPTQFKDRPAMVMSKTDQNLYTIAKITTKDRTRELKGEWIDERSPEFKMMGIDQPSFIRLEDFIKVPKSLIKGKPIGKYPDFTKLIEVHKLKYI